MDGILLSGFPFLRTYFTAENIANKNDIKNFIVGTEIESQYEELYKNAFKNFLQSLLIHEKIYIRIADIIFIASIIGVDSTKYLIKNNILIVLDDRGISPALMIESSKSNHEINKAIISQIEAITGYDDFIDNNKKSITDNKKLEQLAISIYDNRKVIDTKNYETNLRKEILLDLENPHIKKTFRKLDLKKMDDADVNNLLRIAKNNDILIISSQLNVHSISMDSDVKNLMESKFKTYINKNAYDISLSNFTEVLKMKKLPDLFDLFMKGIINIEDIISIRENFNGKLFRQWYLSKDYNLEDITYELMKNNKINKFIQLIRWGSMNALGFISPAVGVASSIVDSFVLDKILNGWHPNIFLDDVLEQSINSTINLYNKKENYKRIIKAYPNITRNDKCVCGSNKKFKKCCGNPEYSS